MQQQSWAAAPLVLVMVSFWTYVSIELVLLLLHCIVFLYTVII